MSAEDARTVRRHFLVLRGLRWLPTGLLFPVLILLLTGRGFSLTSIGVAAAVQGLVVLCLELPTGGLADAVGRRPVLLGATAVEVVSLVVLAAWAHSLPMLALVWGLQGIYRALESGPLDAWYVDAAQAADPDADIEGGLGAGGAVLGTAIAAGALAAAGLVRLAPFPGLDPLVGPVIVAIALRVVDLAAIWRLMHEVRPPAGSRALAVSARAVPRVVGEAVRLVRGSRALMALIAVELFWGFGMASWESLLPARLEDLVGSADRAAALLGPVGAGAWLVSAVAAGLAPRAARGMGAARLAALMRIGQGATVFAMALAAGPLVALVAYVLTFGIHGAANPVHQGLLHREVGPAHRTTVVSANSMMAMSAGSVGGIALGALADGSGIPLAMAVGAVVLAAAAPLYLVARSASSSREVSSTLSPKQRSIA